MDTRASLDAATAGPVRRSPRTPLEARGEPFVWGLGGALAFGVAMIAGLLLLVLANGIAAFWPKRIALLTLESGAIVAGEPTRSEQFRPPAEVVAALPPAVGQAIMNRGGLAQRRLYRTGNYDLTSEDFRWVPAYEVRQIAWPRDLVLVERQEWGVFVGRIQAASRAGRPLVVGSPHGPALAAAHRDARQRWRDIRSIERNAIGRVNRELEDLRLAIRRAELKYGAGSAQADVARRAESTRTPALKAEYERLAAEASRLKKLDAADTITLVSADGKEKTLPLSGMVRYYAANDVGPLSRLGIYLSRWWEFLSDEPREANTEGGVLPAIFGTVAMTLLMVLVVAPFGVITALYLREYARQGRLVSVVRISVNNLAGVPSIVYGVFGLGFFAYTLGASIDQLFFSERLPNPTFGTGGVLWSALTLALMTVPVVIVATEEALAAVPRSMREGSLACGASKWQTIRNIVLPRALPGIMTGIILAMARGAGEVAPLMLVGVVKLAPALPVDGVFPYIHLERSFMHLGFHIYDVGFQSRNSEAAKPMVFVTTCLLIVVIATLNLAAILIRGRLKRRFAGSQF